MWIAKHEQIIGKQYVFQSFARSSERGATLVSGIGRRLPSQQRQLKSECGGMRLARGSATPDEDEDVFVFLGLSPIEPTRAASLFLVYHTARAASGRLIPTRIRSLAAAAVREAGNLLT